MTKAYRVQDHRSIIEYGVPGTCLVELMLIVRAAAIDDGMSLQQAWDDDESVHHAWGGDLHIPDDFAHEKAAAIRARMKQVFILPCVPQEVAVDTSERAGGPG